MPLGEGTTGERMGDMGQYLIWFAAAYLGFRALLVLVVFVQLLRMQLWPARVRALEQAPALAAEESAALDELRGLGFELVQAAQVEYGPGLYTTLLLRHAAEPAYALLSLQPYGNVGFPVGFYSFLADGKLLATANRIAWGLFASPPEVLRTDPCAPSLAAHWEAHRARLPGTTPAALGDAEAARRLNALTEDYLPLLQARGLCARDGDSWHPSVRAAAGAALAWARVSRKLARPYQSAAISGANQVSYFMRCYAAQEALLASRPARHNVKASVLVLSILAALLLWGITIDWSTALMLIVILFVHESGHALLMRRFGYRDMSMFFIPFIGAVVTGKPKELPAWKQALVLFAGPVPGLLAGLLILLLGAWQLLPSWGFDWTTLGAMALTVNLFNLLPITPLDGGQLMGIAVFNRWPFSRLLFSLAGIAGIVALALWLRRPATFFIAAVLLAGLRAQFRLLHLHRAWDETLDRPAQLKRLFETAQARFKVQSYASHAALVRSVTAQHAVRRARGWESALIVAVLMVFWSGAAVAGLAVWRPATLARLLDHRQDSRSAAQAGFDAAFAAVYDSDDTPDLGPLDAAAAALAADDPRRVDLAYLHIPQEPFETRRRQQEALLAAHRGGSFYSLAMIEREWLEQVREHAAGLPPAERAAVQTQAIDQAMRLVPTGYAATVDARLWLAEAVDQSGDPAQAQAMLAALRQRAEAPADGCRCELAAIVRAQSRYAAAHQQPAEAVRLIESAFTPEKIRGDSALTLDYAWALLEAGRTAEGVELMRTGATWNPPRPPLLTRLFRPSRLRAYVHEPLSLAYAWHRAGQDAAIASLDQRMLLYDCQRRLEPPTPLSEAEPWQAPRDAALRDFGRGACPQQRSGAAAAGS